MDFLTFLPGVGGVVWQIVAFVIALSVIVAVHEYGHYIVGRWSGIHADVFSIGFGPVVWSRVDRRGTRWQIAALPLGGFVKFAGDADAASGKDSAAMKAAQADPAALRRTMHGAPLWARTLTVAAGPVFNFIMAIAIFTAVFMVQGEARDPLTVGEVRALPQGAFDLRPGDEIVTIAGQPLPAAGDATAWDAFTEALPSEQPLDYGILRDGATLTVPGPHLMPPVAVQIAPRGAADDINMRHDDVVTAIDGQPIVAFRQIRSAVEASEGRVLTLDVWRDGEMMQFSLAPKRVDEPQPEGGFRTEWRIGLVGGMAFEPATVAQGPVQALSGAVEQTWTVIDNSLSGLFHMITGAISSCNMSGVIGIAETSATMAEQGAESFIWFIAVLSVAVGLLNLFPIPVLDGGHLVFYAYEAVVGRPPSDKALRVLMAVGLTLVLSLMVFALMNDVLCP